MAILSASQAARRMEHEKKRQDILVKKREAQKKKELLGENWKQIEKNKAVSDIELEIGSENTPRVQDFVDIYDYFDPVIMYKSAEGKILNMDFDDFKESEYKFQKEISLANELLKKIDKQYSKDDGKTALEIEVAEAAKTQEEIDQEKIEDEQKLQEELSSIAADDLNEDDIQEAELLKDPPSVTDYKRSEKKMLEGIDEQNEEDVAPIPGSKEFEDKVKLKLTPVQIAKAKLNQVASIYFSRFVPIYSRSICSCCGMPKKSEDFYPTYSISCNSKIDSAGNRRMSVCKDCALKMFVYYYKVNNKNIEEAMRQLCASLDIYWDEDVLGIARKKFDDGGRNGSLLWSYIKVVAAQYPGLTFINSPVVNQVVYDDGSSSSSTNSSKSSDDVGYDWNKQDFQNRQQVIDIIGYDPFEYEENEEDRKILYSDFLSIVDDDISNDYIKCMSAVSIVKSFFTVRKLDQRQHQLEKAGAPLNDQKAISDLKAKELKNITDFAAANGFSERFKTKQSKGENTFTGIVARIDKAKFEKGIANRFDVLTSESIQQASDASFKSIFTQLGMGESELFKITADQLRELRSLRTENQKLQEEIRQTKYKLAEANMKEKLRVSSEKGGGGSSWA